MHREVVADVRASRGHAGSRVVTAVHNSTIVFSPTVAQVLCNRGMCLPLSTGSALHAVRPQEEWHVLGLCMGCCAYLPQRVRL